jgi:hypothetical protein
MQIILIVSNSLQQSDCSVTRNNRDTIFSVMDDFQDSQLLTKKLSL